jgi:hypothetical protein
MTARLTYDSHLIWRRYQPYFPAAICCTADSTPREEYWRWRGLDVHLDRLAVPSAPVKVLVLHGAGAYGRVMAPAAVLARRHGYETVAPNLPGYGLTRVPLRRDREGRSASSRRRSPIRASRPCAATSRATAAQHRRAVAARQAGAAHRRAAAADGVHVEDGPDLEPAGAVRARARRSPRRWELGPARFLRTLMTTTVPPPEHFDVCPVLLAHPARIG